MPKNLPFFLLPLSHTAFISYTNFPSSVFSIRLSPHLPCSCLRFSAVSSLALFPLPVLPIPFFPLPFFLPPFLHTSATAHA
jgi:hypothetical protein